MPSSVYQRSRSSIQVLCHFSASAGGTKNSISICSNSRVRKMKLPGVISLRNDLPTCAIPNGGFLRENWRTFLKLMKMPWDLSGPNDLPTCAIPNGGFLRENWRTFLKLMKMPWAVAGRNDLPTCAIPNGGFLRENW